MNIVNDITYPCYIGVIPKGGIKARELIDSYVVWGYYSNTTLYVYDAIPQTDYENKNYDVDYSERVETTRAIGNYNRQLGIVDLPMVKMFTPKELIDYIQESLFQENSGVLVFSSTAEFNFQEDKSDSFYEILREGV